MSVPHTDLVDILDNIEDSALIELVYVSSLTLKGRLNKSMFKEVARHASVYNKQNELTGILCYGNGKFLQCIEGSKTQVMALQQHIRADKRHKNIKLLLVQTIEQRRFIDWRMRLLFLERWLWSPTTKQQASQLSPFLPFAPYRWDVQQTEQFLHTIKNFDTLPHIKAAGITYNALGNMLRHIAAPHQAFLIIQSLLSVLIIVALLLLYF